MRLTKAHCPLAKSGELLTGVDFITLHLAFSEKPASVEGPRPRNSNRDRRANYAT